MSKKSAEPTIDILDDLELPPARGGGGGVSKYPWATLEVGQGFFLPNRTAKSVGGLAYKYAKEHPGVRFSVRNMERDGMTGVGVKRVEPRESGNGEAVPARKRRSRKA